jgi:tetratricopeptide (TPR) repeat protein
MRRKYLYCFALCLILILFLFSSCSSKNYTIRNDIKKKISYYIEEGKKQFNKGDISKSLITFYDVLNMALSINDVRSEFIIYLNIFSIYIFKNDQNNLENISKKIDEILKFEKEKLSDEELFLYNYIYGDYYFIKNNYEISLQFYFNSLNLSKQKDKIAFINIKIGKVYIELKRYNDALKFLLEAKKIGEEIKYFNILGDCYYNLSKYYYLTKNYEEALIYIKKAFDADNINENVIGIFYDYLLAANIYKEMGFKENEKYYLYKALLLAIYLNLESYIKEIENLLRN